MGNKVPENEVSKSRCVHRGNETSGPKNTSVKWKSKLIENWCGIEDTQKCKRNQVSMSKEVAKNDVEDLNVNNTGNKKLYTANDSHESIDCHKIQCLNSNKAAEEVNPIKKYKYDDEFLNARKIPESLFAGSTSYEGGVITNKISININTIVDKTVDGNKVFASNANKEETDDNKLIKTDQYYLDDCCNTSKSIPSTQSKTKQILHPLMQPKPCSKIKTQEMSIVQTRFRSKYDEKLQVKKKIQDNYDFYECIGNITKRRAAIRFFKKDFLINLELFKSKISKILPRKKTIFTNFICSNFHDVIENDNLSVTLFDKIKSLLRNINGFEDEDLKDLGDIYDKHAVKDINPSFNFVEFQKDIKILLEKHQHIINDLKSHTINLPGILLEFSKKCNENQYIVLPELQGLKYFFNDFKNTVFLNNTNNCIEYYSTLYVFIKSLEFDFKDEYIKARNKSSFIEDYKITKILIQNQLELSKAFLFLIEPFLNGNAFELYCQKIFIIDCRYANVKNIFNTKNCEHNKTTHLPNIKSNKKAQNNKFKMIKFVQYIIPTYDFFISSQFFVIAKIEKKILKNGPENFADIRNLIKTVYMDRENQSRAINFFKTSIFLLSIFKYFNQDHPKFMEGPFNLHLSNCIDHDYKFVKSMLKKIQENDLKTKQIKEIKKLTCNEQEKRQILDIYKKYYNAFIEGIEIFRREFKIDEEIIKLKKRKSQPYYWKYK